MEEIKNSSAGAIKEIGDYCHGLAYEIEQGNIQIVPCSLSLIHRKLCEQIILWNKEINPKWVKGIQTL